MKSGACSGRGARWSSSTRTRARGMPSGRWLPSVAVKWIDERRGLWMYSHREQGARTLVQGRGVAAAARPVVFDGPGRIPAVAGRAGPVSVSAAARHAAVRALGGSGAGRRRVTELYSPMLASLPLLLWKTPPGLELILAQEGVAFETVKDPHPFVVPRRAVRPVRRPRGFARFAARPCGPGSRRDRHRRLCGAGSRSTRSRPWSTTRRRPARGPSARGRSPSGWRDRPRRGFAGG